MYGKRLFNFIQQKSPTSVSNDYSIQWGFKPRLNKVKSSGRMPQIFRGNLSSGARQNLGANTPRRI
ncbi:hypothetical protein [Siminovitchia terrae]|uniref:hypothetical protein n=1 Tax=Siminovitchia terrae TaxID=1914933 RepID=UPI001BB40A77|nr:hypothetical protein [Siminovitchia terrae]